MTLNGLMVQMQTLVALSGLLVLQQIIYALIKHQAHIPERRYMLTLRHQELEKNAYLFQICSSGF